MAGSDATDTRPTLEDTTSADDRRSRASRLGGRAFWTFADQGLSSLTNAALTFMVARAVDVAVFGAFALALLTYSFAVGLSRAVVSEPYVVGYSAKDESAQRAAMARSGGAALALGLIGSLACLVVTLIFGGYVSAAFLGLAICLPGLLVQDNWRHIFFAVAEPRKAFFNDLVWTVLQFAGMALLLLDGGTRNVMLIVVVWGLSANVAMLYGIYQTRVVPAVGSALDWMREFSALARQLGLGFIVNTGAIHAATYSVTGFVGKEGVGGMRGAQTLLGPLNLLYSGFNAFMLPMQARRVAARQGLLLAALPGPLALAVITATWTGILMVLPRSVGVQLLGDTWDLSVDAFLPTGLLMLAACLVLGASNSLIALSRADVMLRILLVQGPLMLGLGMLGAWQFGLVGALYGFAIAQTVGCVLCWAVFLRIESHRMKELHKA